MSNSLDIELTGKYVIVDKKYIVSEFHDVAKRVFLCEGGFGCSPETLGNAVFGTFVFDGEQCRMEGFMFKRVATDEEIRYAKALSLAATPDVD